MTAHVPEVALVDDASRVAPALERVAGEVVGVDVERADAHRYYRRAALVQVGIDGHCVLLDGVTLETMPELDALLGPDRLTVLHAVHNDLVPLAAKGVHPDRLADTAVAAAVLGLPTGLEPLLASILGVTLDGDKRAFQRADWEQRPLPPEMAAYAAGDVVHLPALWQALHERLVDRSRADWYAQELDATLARMDGESRHWERVKGVARLDPRQRAVLRALWEQREAIARADDLAPNHLLHDDVLRSLAEQPPRTAAQLVQRSPRRRASLRQHAPSLLAAVERGMQAEPEVRVTGGRRWSAPDRMVFDELRRARAEVARDVGIDAGVLCPSGALWQVVAGEPADATELCRLVGLRAWQCTLLADVLWDAYVRAREAG